MVDFFIPSCFAISLPPPLFTYMGKQQSTKCRQTLNTDLLVVSRSSVLQTPMRYNQFHLQWLCLLLNISVVIVIGTNGLSDLIMGPASGPECREIKKRRWECICTKMVHQVILSRPVRRRTSEVCCKAKKKKIQKD